MPPRQLAGIARTRPEQPHAGARVEAPRLDAGPRANPSARRWPARPRRAAARLLLGDRASELRSWLRRRPESAGRVVSRAEDVMAHRTSLLGSDRAHLGETIDWHRDWVTGHGLAARAFQRAGPAEARRALRREALLGSEPRVSLGLARAGVLAHGRSPVPRRDRTAMARLARPEPARDRGELGQRHGGVDPFRLLVVGPRADRGPARLAAADPRVRFAADAPRLHPRASRIRRRRPEQQPSPRGLRRPVVRWSALRGPSFVARVARRRPGRPLARTAAAGLPGRRRLRAVQRIPPLHRGVLPRTPRCWRGARGTSRAPRRGTGSSACSRSACT